ncbi:MAG: metallophosphoesterase [Candidatus Magasanikbacteria bacterium]
MNFFSIIILGYFVLAGYLIYAIGRDQKNSTLFFGRHKNWTLGIVAILILGVISAFDARFIEPWTIKTTPIEIKISGLTSTIKIAFISDLQIGNHKKSAWVEKIVERIKQEKPDLVILGGDLIDNEGTFEDESVYLEPLKNIAELYPTFAVLGNHEYGIGSGAVGFDQYYTGNRSAEVIERLKNLNIKLLRNDLACPEIKGQKLCLYGIDDLWGGKPNFDALAACHPERSEGSLTLRKIRDSSVASLPQNDNCVATTTPVLFITHNPDGVQLWPKNLRAPDLTLAGHTHGGQVYLPFIGPIGNPGITLPKKYYRGLNYVSLRGSADEALTKQSLEYNGIASPTARNDAPIYTSVGIGESGGAVRFWTLPEIVIITLVPRAH